jgi:hypothetical protein
MKKLLFVVFALIPTLAFALDQWDKTLPGGTSSPSDLDIIIQENNSVLDRALAGYRMNCKISYASAATVSVAAGELVLSDSSGAIRVMRRNTAATTVTWANIDTGSEATSTTYYVYGVADTDATTFTVVVSINATTPTGCTYYVKLGSFYNDASGNVTNIVNDDAWTTGSVYDSGWFSIGLNVYEKTHSLGTTKCLALLYLASESDGTGATAMHGWNRYGDAAGITLYDLTPTTIWLASYGGWAWYSSGTTFSNALAGYARIILIALE